MEKSMMGEDDITLLELETSKETRKFNGNSTQIHQDWNENRNRKLQKLKGSRARLIELTKDKEILGVCRTWMKDDGTEFDPENEI